MQLVSHNKSSLYSAAGVSGGGHNNRIHNKEHNKQLHFAELSLCPVNCAALGFICRPSLLICHRCNLYHFPHGGL